MCVCRCKRKIIDRAVRANIYTDIPCESERVWKSTSFSKSIAVVSVRNITINYTVILSLVEEII